MECGKHEIDIKLHGIYEKWQKIGESGCQLLLGFPTFNAIWSSADAWRITLMVLNIVLVLIILLIFLKEAKYMHRYFRSKNHGQNRHQRKLIYLEASLPFVLSFNALVISMAPRSFSVMQSFTSVYFALSINGFARMIFDYSGGVSGTVELMKSNNKKVSYKAVPLTCCCPCLPEPEPSKKSLSILRIGVLQTVWVCLICTFLEHVLVYDGSFCVQGKIQGAGLASFIQPSLTIIDLVSTMIAMTSLGALANCTQELLTKYNIKKKFTMFKLGLMCFRLQPSLLKIFSCSLGNLRPVEPLYSVEAWYITVNSYIQLVEFFILSVFLFMVFQATVKSQIEIENRGSVKKGPVRQLSKFVTTSTGHDESDIFV